VLKYHSYNVALKLADVRMSTHLLLLTECNKVLTRKREEENSKSNISDSASYSTRRSMNQSAFDNIFQQKQKDDKIWKSHTEVINNFKGGERDDGVDGGQINVDKQMRNHVNIASEAFSDLLEQVTSERDEASEP